MLFVCYERCTTCKKAEKWLQDHNLTYTVRPIKEQHPTADELRTWHAASGLPMTRFFNTSGQLYRSMNLKDKLPEMSEEDMLALLATDGMLVKRPILVNGDTVLVGFSEEKWQAALLA